MSKYPRWTQDEYDYLEHNWGVVTTASIAKKLNRSISAVKQKAIRRGLGPVIQSSNYLTICEIAKAFNKEYTSVMEIWVKNNGLKIIEKKFVETQKFKVIKPKDFWAWAERNKGLINFAKYERYSLPDEPDWLKDKIKSDYAAQDKSRISTPWTPLDDESLRYMFAAGKYTIAYMAKVLNRTETAIKRRAYDLGMKKNFIRSQKQKYTDAEVARMVELARQGQSLKAIAKAMNRTENSVRGKLERMGYNFKTCTFGEAPNWAEKRKLRRRLQRQQTAMQGA